MSKSSCRDCRGAKDNLMEWKRNYGSEYANDLWKPNDFGDARIFGGYRNSFELISKPPDTKIAKI